MVPAPGLPTDPDGRHTVVVASAGQVVGPGNVGAELGHAVNSVSSCKSPGMPDLLPRAAATISFMLTVGFAYRY